MWSPDELVRLAADGLRALDADLGNEQAVHGLDALDEVDLHPILARVFAEAGFGVLREVPYPGLTPLARLRRERERCDLVLTPRPAQVLRDPVVETIEREREAGTLFSGLGGPEPAGIDPSDAYWLEVKVVAQHAYVNAIPGPNASFAADLTRCAGDLAKLTKEPRLLHAGLLLLLFADTEETATHDAGVFLERCLDRGIEFSSPASASVPIRERILNRVVLVVLTPIRPVREAFSP